MKKIENPYLKAKEFHQVFDPVTSPENLEALSLDHAGFRAGFKAEELVEFLYASAANDEAAFKAEVQKLHQALDQAQTKILEKGRPIHDPLVDQVDALTDLLYFTYGSFVYLGIDPSEIFECVHQANMGKLFPDGKPRYDKVTGKVLKPENWEQDFAPEGKISALIEQYKKTHRRKK